MKHNIAFKYSVKKVLSAIFYLGGGGGKLKRILKISTILWMG
jgi:hypothetical protein